jgi:hypothetical protein
MGTFSKFSLSLNGSTDYASAGNVLDKLRTDTFSLVGWVKTAAPSSAWIVSKIEDPAFRGYGVVAHSTGKLRFGLFNSAIIKDEIETNAVFPSNVWFHLACVSAGTGIGGMAIYVNAVVQGVTTLTSSLATNPITNTGPFNLGARSDLGAAGAPLLGILDDWVMYSGALNGTQIATIYNAGDPPDLNSVGPTGSVESLYEFDGDTLPTVLDQAGANDLTVTGGSIVADAPGPISQVQLPTPTLTVHTKDEHGQVALLDITAPAGPDPIYYKMRGRDVTCPAGQQPAYVYWVVTGAPDEGALEATVGDLICGTDPLTDIADIEVAFRWKD